MNKKTKIDISVVIPAYNEEKLLGFCLESLKNQKFEGKYEIIVVDNGSSDKTSEIAKNFGVKLVSEKRKGIAFARQRGFSVAKGEIIASTDADTILPDDWLEKIFQTFKKPEIAGVTGPADFYGSSKKHLFLLNILVPLFRFLSRRYFWGPNFAIKKEVFEKIGGFNTKLAVGEDCDLVPRAKKFGKLVFKKDLSVKTSARRWEKGLTSFKELGLFSLTHFLNFLWMVFFKKIKINRFYDVRSEGEQFIFRQRFLKKMRIISYGIFVAMVFLAIISFGIFYPQSQIFGKVYSHQKTHQKVVALSFDDGPNEPYTSQILDILKNNDIKATFFLLGQNIQQYPDTVKRMIQEGHVVGNHSYSHEWDLMIDSEKTIEKEISQTQTEIFNLTGKYPHLFRPPHGFKSPMLLAELKKNNLAVIEWSDMTNDWTQPGEEKIVNKIVKKTKKGGIIVLHDGDGTIHGADRSQEVAALVEIIKDLKSKGYQFVTIPELFNIPAYNN